MTPAFPRTFISSGNADPLAKQAVRLASKLERLGVPVDSLFFPDDQEPKLQHEYQLNLGSDAGKLALKRMLAFLNGVISDETVLQRPVGSTQPSL